MKCQLNYFLFNPIVKNKDVLDNFIQKLRDFIVDIIKSETIPNFDPKDENNFKEFCQRLTDLLFSINSTLNDEYKDENNAAATNSVKYLLRQYVFFLIYSGNDIPTKIYFCFLD